MTKFKTSFLNKIGKSFHTPIYYYTRQYDLQMEKNYASNTKQQSNELVNYFNYFFIYFFLLFTLFMACPGLYKRIISIIDEYINTAIDIAYLKIILK